MSPAPNNHEFQEWWNKQRQTNHENSDDSASHLLTVEISSPGADRTVGKDRSRSARQLSWVCLLKFQQIAASVASITNSFVGLIRTANRRIASPDSPADSASSRLYRVIKGFLIFVLLLLCIELAAYFKGWHFSPPSLRSAEVVGIVYANWLHVRVNYLAPPLQSFTNLCIVLFLIQSVDRVILVFGCFWIKFRRVKPKAAMEYKTTSSNDEEEGSTENVEDYPMVLLQIPMCNEREVR